MAVNASQFGSAKDVREALGGKTGKAKLQERPGGYAPGQKKKKERKSQPQETPQMAMPQGPQGMQGPQMMPGLKKKSPAKDTFKRNVIGAAIGTTGLAGGGWIMALLGAGATNSGFIHLMF